MQRSLSLLLCVALVAGQLVVPTRVQAGPNTGPGAFADAITQELNQLGLSSPSGATVITAANGTAAAPAFSYAANTDRGVYNDTGNSAIGLSVGGTERAFLSASSLTCAVKQTWTTGLSLSTTTGHQVGPTDDDFATVAGDARKLLLNAKNVVTDVVPAISILAGQSAYAQATVNTGGANLVLAGGIGRRFYAFSGTVANIAGKTFTITVNGTAVVLTEGADFARGASMTTAATAFAAAVNANGTLGPLVTATASSTTVYVQAKPTCYAVKITDNQLADVPVTSGTDGAFIAACGGNGLNQGLDNGIVFAPNSTVAGCYMFFNGDIQLRRSDNFNAFVAMDLNSVFVRTSGGSVNMPSNGPLAFSSTTDGGSGTMDTRILRGGGAGIIALDDNASGFARLCLGGTTASYPAIKRSAAALAFRLADDSADAGINCSNVTCSVAGSSLVSASLNATGSLTWASRSILTSGADGTLTVINNALNNTTIAFTQAAGISTYKNVATAGQGVPAIYASGRATAQAAANASVATFTPAADGSFEVSMNVLVTTATTHTFTCECAYTDEGNTARILTLPFTLVAGSAITTSITNTNGAVPYMGITMRIRAKASTAITLRTQAAGTYTTVAYNVEGTIKQLS